MAHSPIHFTLVVLSVVGYIGLVHSTCGNSIVESGEGCDNGPSFSAGCTTSCQPTANYYCWGSPSVCDLSYPYSTTGSGTLTVTSSSTPSTTAIQSAIVSDAANSGITASSVSVGTPTLVSGTTWTVPFTITLTSSTVSSLTLLTRTLTTASASTVSALHAQGVTGITYGNSCGDSVVQLGEQCDAGNSGSTVTNGCTSSCVPTGDYLCTGALVQDSSTGVPRLVCTTCGNAVVDTSTNEQCDDGNYINGDSCSSHCLTSTTPATPTLAPAPPPPSTGIVCGNGLLQTGEGCDDGNLINGDGCSSVCTIESSWTCVNVLGQRSVCSLVVVPSATHVCGNGVLETAEGCDDGNLVNGDGCSSNCTVESGWACVSINSKSMCSLNSECALGVYENCCGISCNDGNSIAGDGCTNCVVDAGYHCTTVVGSVSTCTAGCGNGVVAANEPCDDGNNINGDGCSYSCNIESGYSCTAVVGSKSVCTLGTTPSTTSIYDTSSGDGCTWWWIPVLIGLLLLLCLLGLLLWWCTRRRKVPQEPQYIYAQPPQQLVTQPVYAQQQMQYVPPAPLVQKAPPLYVHPPPSTPPAVAYEAYDSYGVPV